jgi:two-component system LytT family sensor kinase
MSTIKLSKTAIQRHMVIWVLLMVYVATTQIVKGSLISQFLYTPLFILNYVIPYYILTLWAFPNFFEKQKIRFTLYYINVIFLFILIDYLHIKQILPFLGGYRKRIDLSMQEFARTSLLHFSFLAFTSAGAYLNWRSYEMAKKRMQKQKDILSKELDFLTNQFLSHFSFNFLNFCYRKVLHSSPKAANSIECFSELLHYSLNLKPEEYITLVKEIEYIENFIEVQKCITSEVFVILKQEGAIDNFQILQGVLSVFVENAFKHGVFNEQKSPIEILISVNEETLKFHVKNKKSNSSTYLSTGIGLQNIKQVLNLFYKDLHSLIITNTELNYISELTLKMNAKNELLFDV